MFYQFIFFSHALSHSSLSLLYQFGILTMSSRAKQLAELRRLRAEGKKRLASYEIEDEGDLYDEVDEEAYKKIVRRRLDEDDFVVDDNGTGYADDGREEWDNERRYDSDESDGDYPLRGKAAKRKRENEERKKEEISNGIQKYFNHGNATVVKKPKVREGPWKNG